MPLSHGRPYLAIPGPSVVPDRVLQAMHRPNPDIYGTDLADVTHSMIPDLKTLAGTGGDVAIYIGNGHALWEVALSNVTNRGDQVLVAVTGAFGHGWADMARGLGLQATVLDFGNAATIEPEQVADALRRDHGGNIRAVLAVHVDTATGVRNDIAALHRAMQATGHGALLMVDCIASMGCDRYEMDAWGADVTIAASQKGLMVPAGLGFVWFNDRADAARDRVDVSRYWDWRTRINPPVLWHFFDGTPPVQHIYALREALDMIGEEGLQNVWTRHETLARTVWAAVDVWGQGGDLRMNISDPALRSHAVTALHLPGGNADRLRDWVERCGVTLGIGIGREPAADYFRIGHMGHVNAHMVLGVLGVMQAGFAALSIPHGPGALDAAAQVISVG